MGLRKWFNWWVAPTYVGGRSRELILVGRGTVTSNSQWKGLKMLLPVAKRQRRGMAYVAGGLAPHG